MSAQLSVRGSEMTPRQQHTTVGFKRSTDCYQRYMCKFTPLAVFHSRAELYHAALLEADPSVSFYVPQPFQLTIGRKRYVPDCYVTRGGRRIVIELKPRGEFDDTKRRALSTFFQRYNMTFEVLANEQVLDRCIEAENWLTILSMLNSTREFTTDRQEVDLLNRLGIQGSLSLGDIIDPGNRIRSLVNETALFRLLHRGLLKAQLDDAPLDYDTRFESCT